MTTHRSPLARRSVLAGLTALPVGLGLAACGGGSGFDDAGSGSSDGGSAGGSGEGLTVLIGASATRS